MTARWLVACVWLVACDRTFGIEPTHSLPPDAQVTCPAIGTAPQFYDVVHQALHQSCVGYAKSTVTGEAMAGCGSTFDPIDCVSLPIVAVGPADGPLQPVTLATSDPNDLMFFAPPVLAPEGDIAYVMLYNPTLATERLGAFTRDAAGTWSWAGYRPIPILATIGLPSSGPHHRMLVHDSTATYELVEDDTGAWSYASQPYTTSELGIANSPIYLSPDALRIVYVASIGTTIATVYSDRRSLDARFGAPVALAGVPWTTNLPFMTGDCSRILFSALDNVLYVNAR